VSNGNADIELLLALNSFFVVTDNEGKIISGIAGNPLFRGFPIFFSFIAIWFSSDCNKRRSRMLIGLFATCLATVFSFWLQHHFTSHIRPLLDPAIHLKFVDPGLRLGWDREGSFPSDTATLYFALVAIIFLENRLVGYVCLIWALVTVGIARIALGLHYPSDIIASLVLGPGCVFAFESIPYLRTLFEHALRLFETRIYLVHALLFMFLAEAYNLLAGLQRLLAGLLRIL
jgi:membrane-associated phospholipid phosphatase